jgi:hypothetical protein
VKTEPGGSWLLDGELTAEIHTANGGVAQISQQFPPGSPARPASAEQLQGKVAGCLAGLAVVVSALTWPGAADLLREYV